MISFMTMISWPWFDLWSWFHDQHDFMTIIDLMTTISWSWVYNENHNNLEKNPQVLDYSLYGLYINSLFDKSSTLGTDASFEIGTSDRNWSRLRGNPSRGMVNKVSHHLLLTTKIAQHSVHEFFMFMTNLLTLHCTRVCEA